eukprot:Phypoly_transcript_00974.p1 GENE.Phypoly_transcript_00974~~Phypoly_transcript_00974.p1  ORF type:complete len:1221 (+),score=192.00 Phypoly_transcript_00974:378-3665(+)
MAPIKTLSATTMVLLKDLIFRGLLPKPCKLAVFYEDSLHGRDYYYGITSFLNRTENEGFFLVSSNLTFPYSTQQNWNAAQTVSLIAQEYKQFSPDILLVDTHLAEFINIQQLLLSEINEAKFKMISYGARGGETEAQEILGKGINGLFFGTWWSDKFDNEQTATFKHVWQNFSDSALPLDYRAACAYEAARALLVAVINSGNFTKSRVRDALAGLYLKDSLFLTEELHFNSVGQADYDFVFEQVYYSDGNFSTQFIYPLNIKQSDPRIFYFSPTIGKQNSKTLLWVALAAPLGTLVLCLLAVGAYCLLRRRSKKKPDLEMQGKAIRKKRKLPHGSRLVSREEFPLMLSNWNVDLGLAGGQCPVDKEMSQTILLTNKTKYSIYFRFVLPEKTHKAEIFFIPMLGTIKKKQELEVVVKIKFFCTAKWIAHPLITASKHKEGPSKMHCPLDVKLDSLLSTRLSYDEVTTEGPAIGEGSYGTVYKGEWRGVPVAVKKLKVQENSYTEGIVDELQREVDIMTTLRHPNIVNFIGASLVPGHLFLVTEFLPLGNLGQYLNPKNNIRAVLKVKIALDCARGMDFLHKCNILHRDLKPDNLLVLSMSRSAPTNVKLTDFGTARAVTLSITKATQMTVGLGTPIYMAPEVLHGDYDQKSDVFSFAILLYELCTQTTPYSRFSRGHKVTAFVVKGKRLEIPPTVPQFFANMITKCWAEKSADRPTFSEIAEELEQALVRRIPELSMTDELSEKESVRKTNKELSVSSIPRTKQESILASVFSPVAEHARPIEGTATSSTLSNLASFSNTTTTAGASSTNALNLSAILTAPTNNPHEFGAHSSNPQAHDEFVVCQVCHSKTSTGSSSKSSTGSSSKSSTGEYAYRDDVADQSTSVNLVEEVIANLTALSTTDLADRSTNDAADQSTSDVAGRSTNPATGRSTNDMAAQSTSVVEEAIANLEALSGGERAENVIKSPSRKASLVRGESNYRIGKVMRALAAGTIHAVDADEVYEGEPPKETKRGQRVGAEEEEAREDAWVGEERGEKRGKEGYQEEWERNEGKERWGEEKGSEETYPKHLQKQQHSHGALERPLQSLFASEFPSKIQ